MQIGCLLALSLDHAVELVRRHSKQVADLVSEEGRVFLTWIGAATHTLPLDACELQSCMVMWVLRPWSAQIRVTYLCG